MDTLKIGVSGFIGALLCVLADMAQKHEASAVCVIANNLNKFFAIPYSNFITVLLIIGIAVALCFIFDVHEKTKAFYLGGSVLAIMMTVTPYNAPKDLENKPNSVQVNVILQTDDGRPISQAVVTLRNDRGNEIIARSRFSSESFNFYQSAGNYKLYVEVPGYRTEFRPLQLREGTPQPPLTIKLTRTHVPQYIDRLFRR